MPNEITAQLSVEYSNNQTMGANREIKFSAFLNEGFDRPFWQEVNQPKSQVWIPAESGEELVTGLYMAASHISKEMFPFSFEEGVRTIDLNNSNEFPRDSAVKWATEKLMGYTVSLVVYSDSGLNRDLDLLKSLDIHLRLFLESTLPSGTPRNY